MSYFVFFTVSRHCKDTKARFKPIGQGVVIVLVMDSC